MKEKDENNIKDIGSVNIHALLFHSYFIYLVAVILGVLFDVVVPSKIFVGVKYQYLGIILIVLGSILAYWAQKTSGNYKEEIAKLKNKSFFNRGPYRYIRNPTHLGLLFMTLGLGVLIESLFSVVFTVIAHTVTKIFFTRKQDKILEIKYGQIYKDYKKSVKNWL